MVQFILYIFFSSNFPCPRLESQSFRIVIVLLACYCFSLFYFMTNFFGYFVNLQFFFLIKRPSSLFLSSSRHVDQKLFEYYFPLESLFCMVKEDNKNIHFLIFFYYERIHNPHLYTRKQTPLRKTNNYVTARASFFILSKKKKRQQ